MYRYIAQQTKYLRVLHSRQIGSLSAQKRNTAEPPTTTNTEKWDLCASVLVERVPIVSKTLNSVEREFQELLWRIEFENSLKSDHELQHERDMLQSELIKTGKIEMDADDSSNKLTAQDKEDAFIEEYKKFTPTARLSQDDANSNIQSSNRCLEDTLYLLVEQQLGTKKHLLLPQGVRLGGETMRQTAERVLREICGTELLVQFQGNAPCGFYKYKYPSGQRDNSIGAKMFFYRATLQQGNVQQKAKYEWSLKSGLIAKLPNIYKESIEKFLF